MWGNRVGGRRPKARYVIWALVALLLVATFAASWASTSALSNRISRSYQRALAAYDLELSVTKVADRESAAITSKAPGPIRDFVTSIVLVAGDEAVWDTFGRAPVGFDSYISLETRIAKFLKSGDYAEAVRLDRSVENSQSVTIAVALDRQARTAHRQALRDDARYKLLSQWAHLLFLLALLLLIGGIGLVAYRRERDRRRASEDSERKIRALLEHGGDAILLVDSGGVITFANEACRRILRNEPDDILELRYQELAHSLKSPQLVDILDLARRSPGQLFTETAPVGDDELTIVEVNVCDYSDRPVVGSAIVNIRDITERLLTQAALRREESFSTDLMEHAPLFVYVKDLDLRFLRVNGVVARILGRRSEEMIGRTAAELFTADAAALLEESDRRAIEEGEFTAEQSLVLDGVLTPVLATYFLLREPSGEPYAVAAVAMDLTEVEALRATERELLAGFAHSTDAMVTSYNGLITSWNSAAEEMFGYTAGDIIGREVGVLVAPSYRDRVPVMAAAVYSGQSVTVATVMGVRKDGSTFVGSLSAAPIVDGAGAVIGVSSVIHDRTTEVTLTTQLRTDAMTGLPNREALIDHLNAVMMMDSSEITGVGPSIYLAKLKMDGFDQLLSVFGGTVAGAFIHIVADRLATFATLGAFVARTESSQFALNYSATSRADAERFLEDVHEFITAPIEVDSRNLTVSITVGVSVCNSTDVGMVLSQAALLSQRVRPIGSHPIVFFDDAMHQQLVTDVTLIDELRSALIERQLVPYFQPIVDLATNEIVGFEALARWPHDTRGLIAPDKFIGLAEDNGLIVDLGAQIRLEACRQVVEWQRATSRPALEMHVNVSAHELNNSNIIAATATLIEETGVDPQTVVFEITESTLANSNEMIATIRRIHALGIRWSVDDFGTGYSSLSYLRRFPIDSMKIDRSFVMESGTLSGAAMVKSIVDIATVLGLSTIAEGIETSEQRDLVAALGGQRGQGFFGSSLDRVGKPVNSWGLLT
ncbi:MAG: EAL domain-containing protein [Acidimicrobiaceae bacterium]|nr:EAL domain-containing protein [Acidimicrobiaceae bacterium]